jgi:hypothetical protein
MKVTDDYHAKVRLWAARQQVVPLPRGPRLPKFGAQRFKSHDEMNRWKAALLLRAAQELPTDG